MDTERQPFEPARRNTTPKKRRRRLTKAEREALNKKPDTNAGVGFGFGRGANPIAFEEGWDAYK